VSRPAQESLPTVGPKPSSWGQPVPVVFAAKACKAVNDAAMAKILSNMVRLNRFVRRWSGEAVDRWGFRILDTLRLSTVSHGAGFNNAILFYSTPNSPIIPL
jgi:hypothetical protein